MSIEELMTICKSLKGVTTDIKWEHYIPASYKLVASKLTKKLRAELGIDLTVGIRLNRWKWIQ